MPAKLDETDVRILRSLLEDGRRSFRQVAKSAGVSTPTVESRVKKMMEIGLIKKIAPIVDAEKLEGGIRALVALRVDRANFDDTSRKLASVDNVTSVYATLGENNLVFAVIARDVRDLQEILSEHVVNVPGVSVASCNVVTKTLKEEQSIMLRPGLGIVLKCDFCGGPVHGDPYKLKVAGGNRFFCCSSCLSGYKEKYDRRISTLIKEAHHHALPHE